MQPFFEEDYPSQRFRPQQHTGALNGTIGAEFFLVHCRRGLSVIK